MGSTYWYAYDRSGSPSGPYFERRSDAEATADDGRVRPIDSSVVGDDAEIRDAGDVDDARAELAEKAEEVAAADAEELTELDDAGDDRPDLSELDYSELKARAREVGIAEEIDLRSTESIREGLRASREE